MSTEDTNISHIGKLLDELNESLLSINDSTDSNYVNTQIDRCILNISTFTKLEEPPLSLLMTIKQFLIDDDTIEDFDYSKLLDLLDSLLNLSSFEEIIKVYSINDLDRALSSDIIPLIRTACKIVSNSEPKAFFLNNEQPNAIFPIILRIYFDPKTDISVITDIDGIFNVLSSDELVRSFLLNENLSTLIQVKKDFDPLVLSRLLELLKIELDKINLANEFNQLLFTFTKEEILNCLQKDMFLFINLLLYYIQILEYIELLSKEIKISPEEDNVNDKYKNFLLKQILPIIPIFGDIFKNNYEEVTMFAPSYFFKFFEKVSYLFDFSVFENLDNSYIKIERDNSDLVEYLSFVNPVYLFQNHKELLSSFVQMKPSHLTILRNLISDQDCFTLIESRFKSTDILVMPYMEQMILLEKMSRYQYAMFFLINSLPKVMSNLIDDENTDKITELETIDMRENVIVNLLKFDREDLNVWYIPLTDEFYKIKHPGHRGTANTKIADMFA